MVESGLINWLRSVRSETPTLVVSKSDNASLGHKLVQAFLYLSYHKDWDAMMLDMPTDEDGFEAFAKTHAGDPIMIDLSEPWPETEPNQLRSQILNTITRQADEAFHDEHIFHNSQIFGLQEKPEYLQMIYEQRAAEDDYLPWVQFQVLAPSEGVLTQFYFWVDKEGDSRLGLYYTTTAFDQIDEVLKYLG